MKLSFFALFLFFLFPLKAAFGGDFVINRGGIVRGDTKSKKIALIFTADENIEGARLVRAALENTGVKGSFFFTGNFYANPSRKEEISELVSKGHYLGGHSDRHLLYCPWENRDSLLLSKEEFVNDYLAMWEKMEEFGLDEEESPFFVPPYEWYNDEISRWVKERGGILVNFTPGTWSNADYTTPDMDNYRSSEEIIESIYDYDEKKGLNGFILLCHYGVSAKRKDLLASRLEEMILRLKGKGYGFVRIDSLLR